MVPVCGRQRKWYRQIGVGARESVGNLNRARDWDRNSLLLRNSDRLISFQIHSNTHIVYTVITFMYVSGLLYHYGEGRRISQSISII